MPERFERLFELPNNLYSIGSPIIVTSGALLKDTYTGSIVVQLKFQSISLAVIKALSVDIAAFDITGKEIAGNENYQYLDLAVNNGQSFGSNKAIILPESNTRTFAIKALNVVFKDGSVQKIDPFLSALPKATPIYQSISDKELVKQFSIVINKDVTYSPIDKDSLWLCTCGTWNSNKNCTHCELPKNDVFSAFNIPSLAEKAKQRLKEEEIEQERQAELRRLCAEEEKKLLAQKNEHKKFIAKKIRLAIVICIPVIIFILLFSLWLYPDVIQPLRIYNNGQELLTNGEYDAAVDVFMSLGEYKDAEFMVYESTYQKACHLLNEGKFDTAIDIFITLEDFKDSAELINEAKYQKAVSFLTAQQFDLASTQFFALGEYKDSQEMFKECRYQAAMQYKNNDEIKKAIIAFGSILDYKTSRAEYYSLQYELAGTLLETGNFDGAKAIYEVISHYEDSANLVIECDYQKACHYFDEKQYLDSITVFNSIKGYLDSEQKISDAYSLYYLEQGTILYEEAKFYLAIESLNKSEDPSAQELIKKSEEAIAFINQICGYYGLVGKVSGGRTHTIPAQNNNECRIISYDYESGCFIYKLSDFFDRSRTYKFNFDLSSPYYFWKDKNGSYGRLEGTMLIENDTTGYYGDVYEEYRKEK